MRTRATTSNAKTIETSAQDRRRAPRVPHRAVLTIRRLLPDGVGAPMTLALADLSSGGMGALHSLPLHVGDQYQVPLIREHSAEPLALVCTVVRCEKLEEDLYSIGFEFNSSSAAVAEASRQLTTRPGKSARRNSSAANVN